MEKVEEPKILQAKANKKDYYFLEIMEVQNERQNLEYKITNNRLERLEEGVETLESDSYLLASLVLNSFLGFSLVICFWIGVVGIGFLVSVLLFLIFGVVRLFGRETQILKSAQQFILTYAWSFVIYFMQFFFFLVMMLPFVFVVLAQMLVIYLISSEEDSSTTEDDNMPTAVTKVLAIVFFTFLSIQEVFSSLDAMGYFYKITGSGKLAKISLFIRVSPQIIQIIVTFYILYFTIYVVYSAEDTVDLIQNFAGLAILLEFDNYMISFLKNIGFSYIYKQILKLLPYDLESEMDAIRESRKNNENQTHKHSAIIKKINDLFKKKSFYLDNVNFEEIQEKQINNRGNGGGGGGDDWFADCCRECLEECLESLFGGIAEWLTHFSTKEDYVGVQIAIYNFLMQGEFIVEKSLQLDEKEKAVLAIVKLFVVGLGCAMVCILI